jgi:hypothetical protein
VLEHFHRDDGILKKGGLDDATVLTSIATLSSQVSKLFSPEDPEAVDGKAALFADGPPPWRHPAWGQVPPGHCPVFKAKPGEHCDAGLHS